MTTAAPRLGALLAIAVPSLLAIGTTPSTTFLNQAAALAGWGVFVLLLLGDAPLAARPSRPDASRALFVALGLLIAAAAAAPLWTGLPIPLAASSVGLLAAAVVTCAAGVALRRRGEALRGFDALAVGLAVAGTLSAAVGTVQVFAPDLSGNALVAFATAGERAVGNLRQPNHLSTLLLWSMVATVWLGESGRLPRRVAFLLIVAMLFGVVLSASRTGMLGVLMITAWGLADRRLSTPMRRLTWLLPLLYVLFWAGVSHWSASRGATFVGEAQLHKSDISSSRFAIWKNTLALIAMHPGLGVGFGEFNFAWSLTPFPDRPVAFFDHTHNLVLQLAVELGIPLAAAVLALLGWALWRVCVAAWRAQGDEAAMLRAALMLLLIAAVHSQLEYPLWYAYFLLPCAFVFGLCAAREAALAPVEAPRRLRPLAVAALVLSLGAVVSVLDYRRVVVIFSPPENATPLVQRIVDGQGSWFFAHHADYAAATSVNDPRIVLDAVSRASHFLLDTRLMVAWARALAEVGDVDRARHLADRLREFRNPASAEFFAACDKPAADVAPPFQCQPAARRYTERDFR